MRLASWQVADIGHSFLPWELHKKWSACLEREFFTQGQRYVQAGMEPPRLMDPSQPGVTEPVNQLAFFNVIAMPLLTTWASVFAQSGNELLAHANSNVRHWERKARDAGSSVSVPIDAAKTSDPAAAGDHASHRSNNSFHAHSSRSEPTARVSFTEPLQAAGVAAPSMSSMEPYFIPGSGTQRSSLGASHLHHPHPSHAVHSTTGNQACAPVVSHTSIDHTLPPLPQSGWSG